MAKKPGKLSRRDFLRDAALAAGAVGAASMLPLEQAGLVTAAHADAKLGAQLIGKLEGPELILDPAKWPTKFGEAPMLAELVKQGKLPPVEQRVPEEPLVIKPVHEIGKYGGTWRRGFTGPGDSENGNRIVVGRQAPVLGLHRAPRSCPCVAREWELSDDGKTVTLFLRKGISGRTAQPFTADDFVFWYEDIYLNKDLVPTPIPDFMINGKSGVIKKIDETTVVFEFPEPNYLFLDILAGDTPIGGGQALRQMRQAHDGRLHARALPQAVPAEVHRRWTRRREGQGGELRQLGRATSRTAGTGGSTPTCPCSTPWKTVHAHQQPDLGAGAESVLLRAWTPQGNQLPYIDRIQMTLAENLEVLNLRAIAGQYDLQERHTDHRQAAGVPREPGQGRLRRPARPRAATAPTPRSRSTRATTPTPRSRSGCTTRDFRRALSLGIDRDQLNETFWLGVGTPGSVAPAETHALQPGPGVAQEVVDARRQAGQRAARQDRPRQEGRRGVPAADRRQGAPAARAADLGGRLRARTRRSPR